MTSINKSIMIATPSRGMIHLSVHLNHLSLIYPVNQKIGRIAAIGKEVGDAYSGMVDKILSDPKVGNFRYLLTLEDDMLPPADGVLKLLKTADKGYDIVGSFYRFKNEYAPYPMVYGDVSKGHEDTAPLDVEPKSGVIECNVVGMGFTLFKLDMFRDERFQRPLFQTLQEYDAEAEEAKTTTQDMFFMMQAREYGYKIACDTDIICGHLDIDTGRIY